MQIEDTDDVWIFNPDTYTRASMLCFLFEDKCFIVDCTSEWDHIENALNFFSSRYPNKEFVILMTHLHPDHWNGVPGNNFILYVDTSRGNLERYYDPKNLERRWEKIGIFFDPPRFKELPAPLLDKNIRSIHNLVETLNYGNRSNGFSIEVIPVKGHTNHDILLKIKRWNGNTHQIFFIVGDYCPYRFSLNDPGVSDYHEFYKTLKIIHREIETFLDSNSDHIFHFITSHKIPSSLPTFLGISRDFQPFAGKFHIFDKREIQQLKTEFERAIEEFPIWVARIMREAKLKHEAWDGRIPVDEGMMMDNAIYKLHLITLVVISMNNDMFWGSKP
ncbi:MAG: MBL fold metallo-hydrolase [Promethearchaeota archaeon]